MSGYELPVVEQIEAKTSLRDLKIFQLELQKICSPLEAVWLRIQDS